jgi:hypothetical protein
MQFDLKRTLHSTPVRHREEVSSLLQTTVAANADCHVGCAGPPSTRSELAKLNLKPALRPMGIPSAIAPPSTSQGYALLGSNDGPVKLESTTRLGCGLCVCCILIVLGLGGVFAYGALKPKTSLIDDKVVAPPPPPPYEFVPIWGKITRSAGSGKLVAKRPTRHSSPPPPLSRRRSPPPPPLAAVPESELLLDILEHGTGE